MKKKALTMGNSKPQSWMVGWTKVLRMGLYGIFLGWNIEFEFNYELELMEMEVRMDML